MKRALSAFVFCLAAVFVFAHAAQGASIDKSKYKNIAINDFVVIMADAKKGDEAKYCSDVTVTKQASFLYFVAYKIKDYPTEMEIAMRARGNANNNLPSLKNPNKPQKARIWYTFSKGSQNGAADIILDDIEFK
jgi:hypothetical protein